MQKNYKGILLNIKVYKENDLIIRFLSDTDEIITGIVYGGLSKKKRNIYQIGFYLNFNFIKKNNKPASINAELTEPYISAIIEDRYKLLCLICVTSLINLSIIEGQKVKNIYIILDHFLKYMFFNKIWFKDFCYFLFQLLKTIGYEIDYMSNKGKKYFDLEKLQFQNKYSSSSIIFPHYFLDKKNMKLELLDINHVFKIFETVFSKYHLSNLNLRLPNQYHLFKKLIIDKLNQK